MKNWLQTFGKDQLDEVVFANRNKAYGAYVLRNEYSNSLSKALFIGIVFFASLSVLPLVISVLLHRDKVIEVTPPTKFVLDNVPDNVQKPKPTVAVPQNIKTVKSPEYVPTRVVRNNDPLPTKKDFDNAAIGDQTKDGKETTISVAPPISIGPPTKLPYTPPVTLPKEDPDAIVDPTKVDISAEFKGGIDAFRQKVGQEFDSSAVSEEGVVSATVTFVVEKDGSISNIKIMGKNTDFNNEAERTIKSIKTKWKPAILNGKNVRSSFRMPISMEIE